MYPIVMEVTPKGRDERMCLEKHEEKWLYKYLQRNFQQTPETYLFNSIQLFRNNVIATKW